MIGGGAYGSGGTITINGGTVTALGSGSAAGIGGGAKYHSPEFLPGGSITINGGTVIVPGEKMGIGGKADATAITLGWTEESDAYTVSRFSGSVTVAEGKTLWNGRKVISGTVSDLDDVDGKRLTSVCPQFIAHSLDLAGKIGVNFFMDLGMLTEAERTNSY